MDRKWLYVTAGAVLIIAILVLITGLDLIILETIMEMQDLPRYGGTMIKYLLAMSVIEFSIFFLGLFFALLGGVEIVWDMATQQKK